MRQLSKGRLLYSIRPLTIARMRKNNTNIGVSGLYDVAGLRSVDGFLHPEPYRFRGVACKQDADGVPYWTWVGPVVIPLEIDVENESSEQDTITMQAWLWCARGDRTQVDTNHDNQKNGVLIAESFLATEGNPWGIKPGSWCVRGLTFDPVIGKKVDEGELNAWSWEGPVTRRLTLVQLSHPIEGSGTTEPSDAGPYPEHVHEIEGLKFDKNARVVPTKTGDTFGHSHAVVGTTRTERTHGHAHGLLIQQNSDGGGDGDN